MHIFISIIQYVHYNSPIYFIKELSIHQPKNINIVIITLGAIDSWSHIYQYCNLNQTKIFLKKKFSIFPIGNYLQ